MLTTYVHIVNGNPELIEIDDTEIHKFRFCSITGELRPIEEFMTDGVVTRTTCAAAYVMPYDKMKQLGEETRKIKRGALYEALCFKATNLNNLRYTKQYTVPVDELISALQRLKDRDPDAKLVFETFDGEGVSCGESCHYEIDNHKIPGIYKFSI